MIMEPLSTVTLEVLARAEKSKFSSEIRKHPAKRKRESEATKDSDDEKDVILEMRS